MENDTFAVHVILSSAEHTGTIAFRSTIVVLKENRDVAIWRNGGRWYSSSPVSVGVKVREQPSATWVTKQPAAVWRD